jgi:23S rRNA (guanosine2251-2'-O)-methyltransferase
MRKLSMEELNRVSPEIYKQQHNAQVVLVLDNVRSMHNVGSAFRTADAFGVGHLYLCGVTGQPPHREIEKTALGATESVSWTYNEQTVKVLQDLQQADYQIVAIEQTDKSIPLQDFVFEPTKKYAFVFGNEVFGVDDSVMPYCNHAIEIPQSGTKHSLNISVCVGVVLWQYKVKM